METYKFDYQLNNFPNIPIKGKVYIFPANKEKGYKCGYSIFVPDDCQIDTTLIVNCCNTGGNTHIHLENAIELAKERSNKVDFEKILATKLKMPMLIPLFPRVRGYYTQALGSYVYNNDTTQLILDNENRREEDKLTNEEIKEIQETCKDMPEQLVNILKDAKIELEKIGITIDDKVIMEGYSAGSKFANLFTALHPEVVKMCIGGGTGGLGILPVSKYKNEPLNFPLGVNDIPKFNYDEFRNIPQLYYIGDIDENDPAMYACYFQTDENNNIILDKFKRPIPIVDETGKIIPRLNKEGLIQPRWKENYTQEEIIKIHTLLGDNIQERFENNKNEYENYGINATFVKFHGDHNSILNKDNVLNVIEYIEDFIKENLEFEKKHAK